MSIGIFVIDRISKEVNMGGNVFGSRKNILGLRSMDEYHNIFKIGVLNLAVLETFIQM